MLGEKTNKWLASYVLDRIVLPVVLCLKLGEEYIYIRKTFQNAVLTIPGPKGEEITEYYIINTLTYSNPCQTLG